MTEQDITIATSPDAPLSTDETAQLAAAEAVIQRGLDSFIAVGEALADIRDARLYRATHTSFSEYLTERWPQIGSRRQADRLIVASEVERDLRPIGLSLTSESQARPLADLSPDERRAAMSGATQVTEGPPTAKQVAQAAAAVKPAPKPCERCDKPSVGYFNIKGVGTHLCATHRDEAQRPTAPAQKPRVEAPAAAMPPPPAPVLTPLTPAAPAPVLTPLASVASGVDIQARKLLAAKRALLAAALHLIEKELERASVGPTVVVRWEASLEAAKLFVVAPALGAAAAMLTFSATVEEAIPTDGPPTLFGIVEQKVADVETRLAGERLTGEEPSILRACRADLDDLVSDASIPTEAYEALSRRLNNIQAQLGQLEAVGT